MEVPKTIINSLTVGIRNNIWSVIYKFVSEAENLSCGQAHPGESLAQASVAGFKLRTSSGKHHFFLLSSPKTLPNAPKLLLHHPRPPVATVSRRCVSLNPRTKRNTLIGAKSSKSLSRIRWRKFPQSSIS